MTDSNSSDGRLDQILADFLAAQERGEAPSPDKLVRDHPEFKAEIRAFLSNQAHFSFDESTNAYTPAGPKKSPRIGNFKLLQRLGEGGMGEVWMADQEKPVRRRVAVKLIKQGMDSKAVLARFDAERQALALMNHPNIAKVFEAGIVSESDDGVGVGRPYFVMELVKGVPITEFCDQRRLPIRDRLELFRQSCSAVHHAHQKGIIHRDLKPSNILVESHDDKPVLKIIDFGLAKAVSGSQLTEQTLFTALGAIAGTPLYMAPEQAVLNAIDIDIRADVYSLGVLLYELLTGSTPLTKDTMHQKGVDELLKMIREYEAPKPSQRLSTSEALPSIAAMRQAEPQRLGRFLRGELDWIVMKALSKERERRYSSAMAFTEDIGRFLDEEPVQAGPPSTAYAFRKLIRRHRGIAFAASAVTGALGLGLAGTTIGFMRAQHTANLERIARQESTDARDAAIAAKVEAELEAYIANIALIQAAIEHNDFDTAKSKLEVCPEHLRGFEWTFLKMQTSSVLGVLPVPVDNEQGEPVPYQFSTDETRILARITDWDVQVFDVSGHPLSEPLEHVNNAVYASYFTADGTKVVTVCYDGKVRLWELQNPIPPRIVYESKNPNDYHLESWYSKIADCLVVKDGSQLITFATNGEMQETLEECTSFELNPDGITAFVRTSNSHEQWVNLRDLKNPIVDFPDRSLGFTFLAAGKFVRRATYGVDSQQVTTLYNNHGKSLGQFDGIVEPSLDGETLYLKRHTKGYKIEESIFQKEAGEYREVRRNSGEFPYTPLSVQKVRDGTVIFFDNSFLALTPFQQAGGTNCLQIWSDHGEKLKESIPFTNTTSSNGFSYNHERIKVNRKASRVLFNTGQNSTQLADATSLELISFPIHGIIPPGESLDSDNLTLPLLSSVVGDDTPIAPALWNEKGEMVGFYGRKHKSISRLETKSIAVVDNVVLNLDKLDNGIYWIRSNDDYWDLPGDLESKAILESFDSVDIKEDNSPTSKITIGAHKVSAEIEGTEVKEIPTTATNPVYVMCPRHHRLFIGDGNNVRVFHSDSLREIASFRQAKGIRKIRASEDGRCIIIDLIDGRAVAWDLRPIEEKQAFWKSCADEFVPASEYTEQLLLTDKPNGELIDFTVNDQSITAKRRWGVARVLLDRLTVHRDLGWTLFREELFRCAFQIDRAKASLSTPRDPSTHKRIIEYALEFAGNWKPESSKSEIHGHCYFKARDGKNESRETYLGILEIIDTFPNFFTPTERILIRATTNYRLDNYAVAQKDMETASEPKTPPFLRCSRILKAMCQWKEGDKAGARETLKTVNQAEAETETREGASLWSWSLYEEASKLIQMD